MSNTTALQDLINWINEIDNSVFAMSAPQNELQMLHNFKNKCKSLLEKERTVIITAVNDALEDANLYESFRAIKNGEQYFTDTFTNQ